MTGHGEAGFSSVAYGRGPSVSATADTEIASGMVCRAEDLEAKRKGESVRNVRPGLARRIGIGPGTLRNIRKRQRKSIPSWLMTALRRVLIEVLEGELAAIEHELVILRATGADPRADAFTDTRARAAALHHLLESSVETG